jgi:hypothetical protein
LFYCGSDQSYVIKFMYYQTIGERYVPVENVTAVVLLLVFYRYQLQFGGAKGGLEGWGKSRPHPDSFPLHIWDNI